MELRSPYAPFSAEFKYHGTVTNGAILPHPDIANVRLTEVLFALSDPIRLDIVHELAEGPMSMADCGATHPHIPKATKSNVMKVLREAGIIRNEPAGRGRVISLRREDLDGCFPGLLSAVLDAPHCA